MHLVGDVGPKDTVCPCRGPKSDVWRWKMVRVTFVLFCVQHKAQFWRLFGAPTESLRIIQKNLEITFFVFLNRKVGCRLCEKLSVVNNFQHLDLTQYLYTSCLCVEIINCNNRYQPINKKNL